MFQQVINKMIAFRDDIFKLIFLNGNLYFPLIFHKFIPKGTIDNVPATSMC